MDQRLSEKIKILRLISIALVVFIHSDNILHAIPATPSFLTMFFINIPRFTLGKLAVPLFFALSGYLFFISYAPHKIGSKIKNRLKTLMVPYFFWNTVALIFRSFQNPDLINKAAGVKEYINYFFYYLDGTSPILYPFWFIRDLVFIFFISPIIFRLSIRFPYVIPIVSFALIVIFGYQNNPLSINIWRFGIALFYFNVGCFLALRNSSFKLPEVSFLSILFIFYILVCTPIWVVDQKGLILKSFDVLTSILGGYLVWQLMDKIPKKTWGFLLSLAKNTFIIFSVHIFFNHFISGFLRRLNLSISHWFILPSYIVLVMMSISFSILVAVMIRNFMPSFYRLVTGNR